MGKLNMKSWFKTNKKILLTGIGIILALTLAGYYVNDLRADADRYKEMALSSHSELAVEQLRSGALKSTITTLRDKNTDILAEMDTKDEGILELQSIIKNKESRNNRLHQIIATQNKTIIRYEDSLSNTVVRYDTIGGNIFPVYTKEFTLNNPIDRNDSTDWVKGKVSLGKESFVIGLQIVNKNNTVLGRNRKNIFSNWKYYTEVTNLNPFTEVDYVRSFSNQEFKKPRWAVGPSVGVGFGPDFKVGFVVGLNITYILISF